MSIRTLFAERCPDRTWKHCVACHWNTRPLQKLQALTARSCGFFRPGNTILVPGMYFFGACAVHDKSHDTPGPTTALAAQHACTAGTYAPTAPAR
jgi:hypothetical protein